MNDNNESKVFWEVIDILHSTGLLPHVMIIGSWAEYLYVHYFGADYLPNLKTRDIDLLYGNYYYEVDGADKLIRNFRNAGFVFDEHFETTGKILKDGLEVEFLTSQMGSGPGLVEIPFTGVLAEKLNDVGMLQPVWIQARGYNIMIPSPASYIAHKLYINPTRNPPEKRPKDIEAIRSLLLYIADKPNELESLRAYVGALPNKVQAIIKSVVSENGLDAFSDLGTGIGTGSLAAKQ